MTGSEFDDGLHIFRWDVRAQANHIELAKREQFGRVHLFSRRCG